MLKSLELIGFKSFAKKTTLDFQSRITSVVGPNGSGKSNCVEAVRFVLGEQSMKSLRGKSGADLIFQGSKFIPKQNRAAVSIKFDNKNKVFKLDILGKSGINLDFDEIIITREIYQDGTSNYLINGTEVRLKDIIEMLASINIGSSGHHIISQGEADRILNASPRERKEMIEDALGLKIYQYRIRESERKIERTKENIKEVSSLRREILPHLNFLKKQVEKIEKAGELKNELVLLYEEYLKKEEVFIQTEKQKISAEKSNINAELAKIDQFIIEAPKASVSASVYEEKLKSVAEKLNQLRKIKDDLSRKLGRLEGILEMKEQDRAKQNNPQKKDNFISFSEVEQILKEMSGNLDSASNIEDLSSVRSVLEKIKGIIGNFLAKYQEPKSDNIFSSNEEDLKELKDTQANILSELEKISGEEKLILEDEQKIRTQVEQEKEALRQGDLKRYESQVQKNGLISKLDFIKIREDGVNKLEISFQDEIKEAIVLIGGSVSNYKNFTIQNIDESRSVQEEKKRRIERIKIKIEDIGTGTGEDVMKEYNETLERDQFLARELEDLNKSIESLDSLALELNQKLDLEFKVGIEKINKQFREFFILMFGGGLASLDVINQEKKRRKKDIEEGDSSEDEFVDEEEIEEETGILINVSLPRKKVKELHALSGGERSLTSIALLFAMSQVNPPPFLILDETDAALDEANSRKYGDMLELLAKYSQLILVTHNRETMSRAGILYGVTVGSDGASRLLSIKFDEAAQIAK
ncbi:MAG: Chromosome partition protein smc [Candidatus Nomurabacteria bacterium GW2011_GWB1_37_5]|uniref:Chromosome partition protein smc n=1 Tax=Candidatus Nomurabacteria bacterium GW2011_GWB1_37_5 TaxID=1618742 RepID=A0A0G0K304_9BACT|nr:MAG: Chromosome partition protein smc [Candidatus Nomurabacteria bacterium GW2011_GWB1_37_5]